MNLLFMAGMNPRDELRYTMDTKRIIDIVGRNGSISFHDIATKLDIDDQEISSHLNHLRDSGLVHREQYDERPPRIVYDLTDKGANVYNVIYRLDLMEQTETEPLEAEVSDISGIETWGVKAKNYECSITESVEGGSSDAGSESVVQN